MSSVSVVNVVVPILIILIIAGIASGVIKATIHNAKFLNGKVIMALLAGYGVILLISVLFTYLISTEASKGNLKNTEEIAERFYAAINQSGNLAEVEGVKVTDEWSFPFQEASLNIKTISEFYPNTWIVVEKDPSLNSELKITRLTTPHFLSDIDYTNLIQSPKLQLEKGTLTIAPPGRTEVRLTKFHKEFPITQFTGEKMFSVHNEPTWSANVLYLQIPIHVHVIADEYINLQFKGQN